MRKWSHFDLKSLVTGGNKIDPGFRVIGEYLSQIARYLESQFNSNILQLLGIPG